MTDNPSRPSDRRRITGEVKWFDSQKGFGFLIDLETEQEVLLHAHTLQNFGLNTISQGFRVEVDVTKTPKGHRAVELIRVLGPSPDAPDHAFTPEITTASDTFVPARVRWFNDPQGFGFVNAFGSVTDHFIHISDIQKAGLEKVQVGEAINVRLGENDRGSFVVEVKLWMDTEAPGKAQDADQKKQD